MRDLSHFSSLSRKKSARRRETGLGNAQTAAICRISMTKNRFTHRFERVTHRNPARSGAPAAML
jgi:hypothetical protein